MVTVTRVCYSFKDSLLDIKVKVGRRKSKTMGIGEVDRLCAWRGSFFGCSKRKGRRRSGSEVEERGRGRGQRWAAICSPEPSYSSIWRWANQRSTVRVRKVSWLFGRGFSIRTKAGQIFDSITNRRPIIHYSVRQANSSG